jgi:hypothetical protein
MTQDEIRRLFEYEPDSGMLRRIGGRKLYPWRGIGKDRRYLAFSYGAGKSIYLHRAVWLWHHGTLPEMIDHIDGDTANCRIENLRPCTSATNQYNSRRKSNNRSGFKGVVYRAGYRSPWQARITFKGKPILIGRFNTPEEAHKAYADMAFLLVGDFFRKE